MTGSLLISYLPTDRLLSLARGEMLPDHAHGSALFADISGFTPLTEELTQTLGVRRGIETLTQRINAVYDALIGAVERCGGSVVGFAGDSITCWFDDMPGESAARAAAAAQAMQVCMQSFEGIALKVAVTSGPVRRFAVGHPDFQCIDTLAGATVARLSTGEQLARPGEILVDAPTFSLMEDALQIKAWRMAENGEHFAVVETLKQHASSATFERHPIEIDAEVLRPWVLPAVYERVQNGHGAFLTELRPAVALFMRFSGIDYDGEAQAGEKLDAITRRAQQIVVAGEGVLLQLTIGDKGSYYYACFGAPTAHEDDAVRAVHAALSLRQLPNEFSFLQPVQIGMSSGTMRAGASGGSTRRTYVALGDEVNLAARLMTNAAPGEILISGRVQKLVAKDFSVEPRPLLALKGKAEPLPVFAVTGMRRSRAIKLEEPHYALPMIGRQAELALIEAKLQLAVQGQGQVIGITAEAGMGKSRLLAEVIRAAHRLGFSAYGGACQSSGINTAYLVWKPIWQAFFDVDPQMPLHRLLHRLQAAMEERAPSRLNTIPLLAPLLDVALEDNDFARALQPQDRRNVLMALLEDYLKSTATEGPLLLVLEDLHWIDPLSDELLDILARFSANLPVCFVLAYRLPETAYMQSPRVEALPHFSRVMLDPLSAGDAEQLIRATLALHFPEHEATLPQGLAGRVNAHAEGNPFYIEELLNYLHDRAISPYDAAAVKALDLPNSLHSLILSRVDQLAEAQQVTLKTASIIGRLFRVAWLHGYYPSLGTIEHVKTDLTELARLNLTPLDTPEPELAYLFKHMVTQEVAYENLTYATRAQLHEQLALYLEGLGADRFLDLLAYHYGRSDNMTKQREYFRKAGDAAEATFANETALDHYARLLPLLSEGEEQAELHLRWGAVLERLGRDVEAETHYKAALAQAAHAPALVARSQTALGKLHRVRGDYGLALEWLAQARQGWEQFQNRTGLSQVLIETGMVFYRQGAYDPARSVLLEGLALAREIGDKAAIATSLSNLGLVAHGQGEYSAARAVHEESLLLRREMGDKAGIAISLNNLGNVAYDEGNYAGARALHEESLLLRREMGDKAGTATSLSNLGLAAYRHGDYAAAHAHFEESLPLCRAIGRKSGIAIALSNLGLVAYGHGDYASAGALYQESLAIFHEMGDKWGVGWSLNTLGIVAVDQGEYAAGRALFEEGLLFYREAGHKQGIAESLNDLGSVATDQGDYTTAQRLLKESLELHREIGDKRGIAESLNRLGSLALVQEQYAAARALFEQSLPLCHTIDYREGLLYCLAGLASVNAAHQESTLRAAQLAGVAEVLRAVMGAVLRPFERGVYERAIATVKATLSEDAFHATFEAGQKMTLEEAVQLALEDASR